jgi:cell division GTPase FtsZ
MENIGTQGFSFDLPKGNSSIIKVIGVGGGGNNALKHMYEKGIHGVDFVICNTDAQTLDNNPVANKVQLGTTITEGLGAGADPEVGKNLLSKVLKISKRLWDRIPKWFSSLPEWVVVQEPELLLLLLK